MQASVSSHAEICTMYVRIRMRRKPLYVKVFQNQKHHIDVQPSPKVMILNTLSGSDAFTPDAHDNRNVYVSTGRDLQAWIES